MKCNLRLRRKRTEEKYNSARFISTDEIRRRIQSGFIALFEDQYNAYLVRLFLSTAFSSFIVGIPVWGPYGRIQLTTEFHCCNLHLSDTVPYLCVSSPRSDWDVHKNLGHGMTHPAWWRETVIVEHTNPVTFWLCQLGLWKLSRGWAMLTSLGVNRRPQVKKVKRNSTFPKTVPPSNSSQSRGEWLR
jgi:hypothetical protein